MYVMRNTPESGIEKSCRETLCLMPTLTDRNRMSWISKGIEVDVDELQETSSQ